VFDQLLAEKAGQEAKLASVKSLAKELEGLGVSDVGPHKAADIEAGWKAFLADADARKAALAAELSKQQKNEQLRVAFAQHAKELHSFLEEK